MQKSQVRRAGALLVGLTLVVAACGSDSNSGGSPTTAGSETTAAVSETTAASETTAGSDTTVAAAAGSELKGMKGTTPMSKGLAQDFKDRLGTTKSGAGLKDYNYAAETYDAIVLIALAADEAKSDGSDLADHIVGLTKDGTKCTDYKACADLIAAGTDVDYDGQSGPLDMNGNGEPLQGSYGVLVFGDGNQLDDSLQTFVDAKAPASDVLPAHQDRRRPQGRRRAHDRWPAARRPVRSRSSEPPSSPAPSWPSPTSTQPVARSARTSCGHPGDSGDTSTDIASQTTDRLLGEGVDAIIGAASSSVSLTVIDKITAAGVVQFSPANTSLKLSYPEAIPADHSLYFRDAPPDTLQGTSSHSWSPTTATSRPTSSPSTMPTAPAWPMWWKPA